MVAVTDALAVELQEDVVFAQVSAGGRRVGQNMRDQHAVIAWQLRQVVQEGLGDGAEQHTQVRPLLVVRRRSVCGWRRKQQQSWQEELHDALRVN